MVKNLPTNEGDAEDMGLIPELARSSGGGNGNPLQYSWEHWENSWTEEPGGLQSTGSQRVGLTEWLSTHGELKNVKKWKELNEITPVKILPSVWEGGAYWWIKADMNVEL